MEKRRESGYALNASRQARFKKLYKGELFSLPLTTLKS